ncbi:MAG: pyridoxal 5'-phosphate synthase glutaminase subunit PdxT [Desulfobacteraceae bacterium]|nr:pyridoxal 5'-phosphate synthase glutaminase subunit PdxT [Desulfobacteraceae bacterium]
MAGKGGAPHVGVLALQGGVIEHVRMLRTVGAETVEVRLPHQLEGLDALVIPGGESTTIGKLVVRFELLEPLRIFAGHRPVWGTCAGMILLARDIGKGEPLLGLMDICVERNAFGRQTDSFTAALPVPALEQGVERPFPAVFIRAPIIRQARGKATELARLSDGSVVAAREGRWLATSFHPELTGDDRFHRYFLEMVRESVALP